MKSASGEGLAGRLGHDLSAGQEAQLAMVLAMLEDDAHAPTAVRSAEEAVDVHLADSLAALDVEAIAAARRIADLGSGAGFPGLALAVALPQAQVSLVESQRRRCEFLERVCERAGIENARVVHSRAESWREGGLANDAVLARALAPAPVVLEYAAPLLRLGGSLVDWRGRRVDGEEEAADRAADALGMRRVESRRVEPFEGARDHHLYVYLKVRDTPERFPRRPGIARKRPL